MATINNAIQEMVDHLVTKMRSNEKLSAEEQTLVSNAIQKLGSSANLEAAILAVAEGHLDDATNALQQVTDVVKSDITAAKNSVVDASSTLVSNAQKLAQLDEVTPLVKEIQDKQKLQEAKREKSLFAIRSIETPGGNGNFSRSTAVMAIYDSNGETYLTRPSYTYNSAEQASKLQHVKLDASGNQTVLRSSLVNASNFQQNPSSYTYYYSTSALVPLGLKEEPDNIAYEVVYSNQKSQNAAITEYAGIFVNGQGYETRTLPEQNLNATDQFGIETMTSHKHDEVAVLYDNTKHCLVMVEATTNLIVEKYRNGNIITGIGIANSNELQEYVDSGNFTTLVFMDNHLPHPVGVIRGSQNEGTMSSQALNYEGFFGVIDGEVKLGKGRYSAHYRFTENRTLEPLNYTFVSNSDDSWQHGTYGTTNGEGEVTVLLESVSGEILGTYSYRSKSDVGGKTSGLMPTAIMAINPYSHVGLLNEFTVSGYYGLGRTFRAI
ncbi:hypothetical protein [Pseudoalteromonas sp. T1lg23B]|uniref:hypothetical protein n=1 Tax=Pseudoalteromonas sp. T1lg23B TaxID=2077097 RepID=UPI000CF62BA8|nr:hypothetical protein [Pseudoalteromonas sp. T1lg23B]